MQEERDDLLNTKNKSGQKPDERKEGKKKRTDKAISMTRFAGAFRPKKKKTDKKITKQACSRDRRR